ncbi:hypothetical protein B5C28_12170 [Corynebacterium glutamicum]|nr:hypothetical protein B5C28_12170 [Corynebacterium glutamicum]
MTVGADDTVTITVPSGPGGENQLAVYEAGKTGSANVLGWSTLTIAGEIPVVPEDPETPVATGSTLGSVLDSFFKVFSRIFGGLSALFAQWFGGLLSS